MKSWLILLLPLLGVWIGIERMVIPNRESFDLFPPTVNDWWGLPLYVGGWFFFWALLFIWYELKKKYVDEDVRNLRTFRREVNE